LLRPSHLKDCLSKAGVGTELCEALGGWCDVAIEGRLPVGCRDLVCGANLIPLNKKDGGIRPIAVGDTLRRVVGKVLLRTGPLRAQVARLAPKQCARNSVRAGRGCTRGMQWARLVSCWV
jgi:hypothetical protein